MYNWSRALWRGQCKRLLSVVGDGYACIMPIVWVIVLMLIVVYAVYSDWS